MGKTKIEWSDMSWPVVTGCTPCSIGCINCYAARMAATRLKHHPRYEGLATIENGRARWTGKIRLNRNVLDQPLHWKKPRRVFIASMGDLFHKDVPTEFITSVFKIIADTPQHTYQVLTKRAARMSELLGFWWGWEIAQLKNLWLGVSVENQAAADERIPLLLQTPAAVHCVSVEPMLGPVDLRRYFQTCATCGVYHPSTDFCDGHSFTCSGLSWVICGGESGPGARPMHPGWARSLRDQCQAAGVQFFFKSWGAWLHVSQCTGQPLSGPHHWWGKETLETRDISYRVGKKAAGHLLDGRAWQEFPVCQSTGRLKCS